MQIADRIKADVTSAMKAGERNRVTALRLVLSELQKAAKEGDADELAVLRRERKRRREAEQAYRDAGREDLADGEAFEAAAITTLTSSRAPRYSAEVWPCSRLSTAPKVWARALGHEKRRTQIRPGPGPKVE